MRGRKIRGNKTSRAVRELRTSRAIAMLRAGYRLKDIAKVLGIARSTLWANLRSLGDGIQAANRAELAELHRASIRKIAADLIRRAMAGDARAAVAIDDIFDHESRSANEEG